MEPVFMRFDSYNFEADRRFTEGLTSVNESEIDLLNLKLYFYNRFVEPIDRNSYKQWRSSQCVRASGCDVEQLGKTPLSQSDFDLSKNRPAETSAHTETKQLSFAEVMRLVQEGKEIPRLEKLDIQPSNQSPTPSQMERMLKPWETAPSSK